MIAISLYEEIMEKRLSIRMNCLWEVRFGVEDMKTDRIIFHDSFPLNISKGGVLLESPVEIPLHTEIQMKFFTQQYIGAVKASGTVVRCEKNLVTEKWNLGVRSIDIEPKLFNLIKQQESKYSKMSQAAKTILSQKNKPKK